MGHRVSKSTTSAAKAGSVQELYRRHKCLLHPVVRYSNFPVAEHRIFRIYRICNAAIEVAPGDGLKISVAVLRSKKME